jgi:hypothetical protein
VHSSRIVRAADLLVQFKAVILVLRRNGLEIEPSQQLFSGCWLHSTTVQDGQNARALLADIQNVSMNTDVWFYTDVLVSARERHH